MKILLTGSNGFVGRALHHSLSREHEVLTVARSGADFNSDLAAIQSAIFPPSIDAVIHTAATIDVRDPELARVVNVEATIALARYAVRAGARQFLFFSTGGVYAPRVSALHEESPLGPRGLYAESKLQAEQALAAFDNQFDLKVFRLFFPYGRGQSRARFLPRMVESIHAGEPVRLASDADGPALTLIHVEDLVEIVGRALRVPNGFTANVGGPEQASIRELAQTLAIALSREARFVIDSDSPLVNWRCDISRITALCGAIANRNWRDALPEIVRDMERARW